MLRQHRLFVVIGLAATLGAGCFPGPSSTVSADLKVEPSAATWKTMVAGDADAFKPAAPPKDDSEAAKKELEELKTWQAKRTDADKEAIKYWNDYAAPIRWSEIADQMLIDAGYVPPRAARAQAMVHVAMYDAVVAAWKAKAEYKRSAPKAREGSLSPLLADDGIPSYPSEHAAVSAAAVAALSHLFPEKAAELAEKAAKANETRLAAGVNVRSDIDAGKAIGEAVAAKIVERANADGAANAMAPELITAMDTSWGHANAMTPKAGTWKPWLMTKGDQFRLATPSVLVKSALSTAYQDELAEVNREVDSLPNFAWKLDQARFWNFDVPAIIWNKTAKRFLMDLDYNTPQAARVLGVLAAIEADVFIACWDTKYAVLRPRPADVDGNLQAKMPFQTPPHPSYPSGHSAASMAAATYLTTVFTKDDYKRTLMDDANQAAMSRLYAGIHYRSDNADGQTLGKNVADYAIQKLKDGGVL
ncbi:phosphatase PAP2 family protein [Phenylobacterium sp.]|uniref:phosphatase PAP2 family protein n=1 Tax=Phenylobacterium sp. TaxID=1871053 RepID=UPI002FC61FBE